MKTKNILFIASALLLIFSGSKAQNTAKDLGLKAITTEVIQGQLEFLASDWTQGRETGTEGAYMAADYIASMFKLWGLEPGGDMQQRMGRGNRRGGPPPAPPKRTYFQNFNMVESWPGDKQELSVVTQTGGGEQSVEFNYQTDFSISGGSIGISGEVPVVFVGYGLKDESKGYDDFKGLDLKGKIVVKLSGFPGHLDPQSKTYAKFKPEESENNSPMWGFGRVRYPWAAEMGILAVIEVNPRMDPTNQWISNITPNAEINGPPRSGIDKRMRLMEPALQATSINFTVTQRVVNELVSGLEVSFEALEKKIAETGKPASQVLPGKYIRFKTSFNSRIVKARNVVGVLEGKDTTNAIVIGAHYDHVGMIDGWIFNGADDNASGTVGVMTIAKAMMATGEKPEKTLIFCAWTGEEKGLRGSAYFAQNHYDYQLLCNLNYDMISRNNREGEDQDKKISMTYTNTFPILKEMTEKHNQDYQLGMEINFRGSPEPRGGSDHASFTDIGVPIFYFMAGMPAEYHQPQDHIDLIIWDKMLNIIKLGYLNIYELANRNWE